VVVVGEGEERSGRRKLEIRGGVKKKKKKKKQKTGKQEKKGGGELSSHQLAVMFSWFTISTLDPLGRPRSMCIAASTQTSELEHPMPARE